VEEGTAAQKTRDKEEEKKWELAEEIW